MITKHRPSSREEWLKLRHGYIGASEAPALIGIHPYLTPFELFARKTGAISPDRSAVEVRENSIHLPPMERGNFFEGHAIELARRLRPQWEIFENSIPGGVVYADRAARISSTPDALVSADGAQSILQIKNVEPSVFRREWMRDGAIEPPLWIAVQAMLDCHLSQSDRAYVGAMVVSYNVDFHLIEVPTHEGVIAKVRSAVADFWDRVARDDPPPPDYARDGDVLKRLYAADDGSEIDLSTSNRAIELVAQREALKAREADGAAAAKERAIVDAELLDMIGHAQRATLADGRVIEAKTIKRGAYAVAASSYRSIKIKEPK